MSTMQKNPITAVGQDGSTIARHEQQILDTSSIGVLITRITDGTILYANKAIASLMGHTDAASVIGMPVPDFYWDPEVRNRILLRFRAEGSITNNEILARRADGSMRWASISIYPFSFEGEQVLLSEIIDITDRKQAEEALKASEERFHTIYENVTIGLYRTTPDGRILMLNPTGVRMLGYDSFDEIARRNLEETGFEANDARKEFREKLEREGSIIGYESSWEKKDGSTIFVRESAKVFRDENGKVLYYDGSFEDITERKQAEEALYKSEANLSVLFDSNPTGMVLIERENRKIVNANVAAAKLIGIPKEEVIGRICHGFMCPAESTHCPICDLGQAVDRSERMLIKADGSQMPILKTVVQIKLGGKDHLLESFIDNTERKKAEAALLASEERFRRFTEVTIEALVFHEQGRIVDANPAGLAMFGISENTDFVGRNLMEFIVPESHKLVLQQMQLETVKPYEIQCIREDGSIFPVETSTRTYKVDDRTIRASSIRDITDRKQIEQNLQLQSAALESAANSIVITDHNGSIIWVNPAFTRTTGFTAEEVIGKNPRALKSGKHSEEFYREMWETILAGQVWHGEIINRRKDGSIYSEEMSITPVRNEHGEITHFAAIKQDISERKRAEEALRDSQQLLRTVMDNIPLSVFWKDTQLNFLGCNRVFAADVGKGSPSDVIGKSDFDMPSSDHAEEYRADDSLVIQSGTPKINYEESQTTPDGSTNWLRTSKIPMRDADGKIFAMLGMYEDITEQKQLQQKVEEMSERRGFQVQISTEISQEIASATEIGDLFARVVTLTKERLGYYHSQLLRYDVAQDAVVLISGYGETGQKMLASGHKLPMGSGLIGTAAASGQTVLRPTLAEDPDWRPNPLLPETKGEIAVPIKWQNTILGVLDVQSNQAGSLTEDDRLLLEGLCGQIAIAMHSAELVEIVRQNEARLAEALKTARLANWEYDVEKDIFTFNDQFYSIFHTNAENAGGYQLSSARYAELFVYPDDMELVGTEIGKALSSTERVYNTSIDHRILYADGGIGYITVKLTVERDENGKITRYYGANQDITERKQTEARLAEALKTARLANWEYDVEKDIFTFNDQFYSIFHTTAEKAGGYQLTSARYAELFVYPDDLEVVGSEIGKALSSTERVYNASIDHRILYADGGIGYITVKLTVERDENGKITRYYGANQDITERKQAEEALRRNEQEMADRLEEVNRLYLNMSQEGWKTYRETAYLPAGFMYDQAGLRASDEEVLADELFVNIPMRVPGGEVVGTLTVANDPRNPTSDEDRIFLQQVSDQIALAMESARLAAQTQTALAQSENLFESSRRLSQAVDLQELVKATIETLNIPLINRAVLGTFSYNTAGELEGMTVAANWWNGIGTEVDAVGKYYSAADLQVLSMFLSPTPLFFNDMFHDERIDPATLQVAKSMNICGAAVLPLLLGTHQLGIVLVESEEPHDFTQDEIRLYSALAPQIATMLENRRQFERAQKQAERESTLNIISQKIQNATTVEAVLQIAARELGHALGAPMTIAQLSMKDKN